MHCYTGSTITYRADAMHQYPTIRIFLNFTRLNVAAQEAANRSEELFEQQKQFIGNASHELQTPLAILGNRLEWLLDNTELNETQIEELFKMQRTLGHIVRLNKTLLLLTKIENGQFPREHKCRFSFYN